MENKIRQPKQERSIETKKKLIDAGYALFAEQGYFKTNTAQIAKRAGVSTGIVYGYFKDKKDILLCVCELYIENVYSPALNFFKELKKTINLKDLISNMLDSSAEIHKKNEKLHQVLNSVSGVDEDINQKFMNMQEEETKKFKDELKTLYPHITTEKVHLIMNLIENYSHELVFDNHSYIDYNKTKDLIVNIICSLIEE